MAMGYVGCGAVGWQVLAPTGEFLSQGPARYDSIAGGSEGMLTAFAGVSHAPET